MNLMYAGKLKRPDGVDENDPVPIPVHNPFPLYMQCKWVIGGYFKNLESCDMYVTVKDDLTDLDASAAIQLYKGGTPDPFTIVNADTGLLRCTIPGASMAGLTVGTIYYVDVELIDTSGEPYTIFYDTIRPFQPVTKATAAP